MKECERSMIEAKHEAKLKVWWNIEMFKNMLQDKDSSVRNKRMTKINQKTLEEIKMFLQGCTTQPHCIYHEDTKTYESTESFFKRLLHWCYENNIEDEARKLLEQFNSVDANCKEGKK